MIILELNARSVRTDIEVTTAGQFTTISDN